MLHIILTLLKIIGIFLLILLGILLFLVITVLAAPVSYEFSGGWDGKMHLKGRISWLYHIVGVAVSMKNGQMRTRITLFGRPLGNKAGTVSEADHEAVSGDEAVPDISGVPDAEEDLLPEMELSRESGPAEEEGEDPEQTVPAKPVQNMQEDRNRICCPEPGLPSEKEKKADKEMNIDTDGIDWNGDEIEENFSGFSSEDDDLAGGSADGFAEEGTEEDSGEQMPENSEANDSLFSIIRRILDFINLPSVRRLLEKLWKSIRRIIRHVLPSELTVRARIGMDDPALTGKIMELTAVLYAFYGDHIEVTADFDEKVLKAAVSVKGRLVPGYLIVKILEMGLRILLNRECRALYRDMKANLT
ncbi:MAG: DUF2953 domain-containing protein [Lachnospiraceae bacterium]|nr:DUF2953 domain-containing protein [Lachnospiraceae bacterium]